MKSKSKNLFLSGLLTLILCIGLAFGIGFTQPNVQSVYALDGAGTEVNPFQATTYSELKFLLESETDCYIVVNSFQKTNGKSYYQLKANDDYTPSGWGDIYGGAIKVPLGYTKHLTINTDIDCRVDTLTDGTLLYSFINNRGNLYIDGTGSLNVGFNANNHPNAIIFNSNYLSVEGDVTFDATQKNLASYGVAVYNYTGYFDIYSGTFIGNNASERDIDAAAINMYGNNSSNESTIYGGKFRATQTGTGNGFSLGLKVEDQSAAEKLNLAGGTFESIRMDSQKVTSYLSDVIADGCHYEKNGETYSYNQNKTAVGTIKVVNPARTISLVDLTIANPLHGTVKTDAESTTNHVVVAETQWLPDPSLNGGTFVGGNTYQLKVRIKIESGYAFASSTRVRINGSVVATEDLSDYNYTVVSKYFDVDKPDPTVINNVAITVTSPIDGGTPTEPTATSDVFYVGAYEWSPNSTFVADQNYTLTILLRKLNANNIEYTFVGMTNATINGQSATINTANSEYALISYTFTVPTPQYTVSFNSNGGTGTMADDTNQFGGYILPDCTFTAPAGQHFLRWTVGSPSGLDYSVGEEYDVDSNVTFYAVWENNAFTQQPISQAKNIDGGDTELSPDWKVNFTATKYEVMKNGSVYTTVNHAWFDVESDVATSMTFTIRAYYDETNYIESDEFTLTWATNIRQVIYGPGDAMGGSNNIFEHVTGDTITILSNDYIGYEYEGFTFDYWSIRILGDNFTEVAQKNAGDTYTLTDSIIVVAMWKEKEIDHLAAEYTGGDILAGNTLDTNNVIITLYYNDGSSTPRAINQAAFKVGTTDILTIEEYEFTTLGAVVITVTSENVETTMSVNVIGYTVSFNADSGEGLMASQPNQYGNFVLPISTTYVAPEGKQFYQWAAKNLNGVRYNGGDTYTVTENVEFYAIWVDKIPQSLLATYGATITIGNKINAEKINISLIYTDGSKIDVDADVVTYWSDNNTQIQNPVNYIFNELGQNEVIVKYNGVQTVMNIEVVGFEVTFSAGDGTGEMAPKSNVYGTYTLPTNKFTAPANKQFKCWSVGGSEKQIGDEITVSANTTVTAVWENIPAVKYNVTFNNNGGAGEMATENVAGTYILPACEFDAPEGKQFKCWLVGQDEKNVGQSIVVSENTTITAVWIDTIKEENIVSGDDLTTIFENAKNNKQALVIKVNGSSITFNKAAVNAIAGNTTALTFNISSDVNGLNVAGAQRVINITLSNNVFIDGKATVVIPLDIAVPEGKIVKVYYVDGNTKTDMNAVYENGNVTFTTEHFSQYVIAFEGENVTPENPETPTTNNGGLGAGAIVGIIIAALAVLGGGAFCVYWFVIRKKKLAK